MHVAIPSIKQQVAIPPVMDGPGKVRVFQAGLDVDGNPVKVTYTRTPSGCLAVYDGVAVPKTLPELNQVVTLVEVERGLWVVDHHLVNPSFRFEGYYFWKAGEMFPKGVSRLFTDVNALKSMLEAGGYETAVIPYSQPLPEDELERLGVAKMELAA